MLSKTSVCSLAIILALFCLIGTKQYGRAKVIGERTAGVGYNNVIIPLDKGYSFSVSFPVRFIRAPGKVGKAKTVLR